MVRYEPGGQWLYAKLHAIESSHEALLTSELPGLLAQLPDRIDRWFFVRYRDRHAHVRLRLHGDAAVVNEQLIPMLHDWAARARSRGMVSDLSIHTYQPEINRYGGPRVIVAAERSFCADSAAVIGQLQRRTRQLHDLPIEVLAAMNLIELLRAVGDGDWMGSVLTMIPKARLSRIDRSRLQLVDPAGCWDRLAGLPGGGDLMVCWKPRVQAAAEFGRLLSAHTPGPRFRDAVSSVLHMHANRLIGLDKSCEDRALAIVRQSVQSFRTRATAGGTV